MARGRNPRANGKGRKENEKRIGKGEEIMEQERIEKIRDALFKRFYGEDYTMEEVEDHRREKNTERVGRWRDNHREHYSSYQNDYQKKFRLKDPTYYRDRHRWEKAVKNGKFTGTFKEWRLQQVSKEEQ
jgi:hypothetical protein